LIFAHANGFPPGTYEKLLRELSAEYRVSAFSARALWPEYDPSSVDSWIDLAQDLRGAMKKSGLRRVLGVGHSLGGALMIIAAAAEPGLFSALALIDPVVFTGGHALFWGVLKGLGFGHRLPLIRGARRRRERFPDFDAARSAYAGKSVFSTWDPEVLDDYVRAGFRETGDGEVELRYPKTWEARIFELTPASVWSDLRRIELPTLVIRGASSDTFRSAAARRVGRELAGATIVELAETSHFLPMEAPVDVARLIVDWHRRAPEGA
jgi:pimeloyl-ACP methyl ester carboxylesterase